MPVDIWQSPGLPIPWLPFFNRSKTSRGSQTRSSGFVAVLTTAAMLASPTENCYIGLLSLELPLKYPSALTRRTLFNIAHKN